MNPAASTSQSVELNSDSTLTETAYYQILHKIISGELPAGTELKSTRLARELDLSRTPILQALSRLLHDGIVIQEKNHRATVVPGAERWLMDIHELRILLEPPATEKAAHRLTEAQLAELRNLADAADPTKTENWKDSANRFDYQLHITIAEACGNLPLQESIRKCMSFKLLTYSYSSDAPDILKREYHEHLEILSALEQKLADTAGAAMKFHLLSSTRYLKTNTRYI
ncbi:transcriptional regulator NanR [Polystyrenella longa]|uniref:Transcriptional regulator NanR n=1 Tax=Polystyrenella longa TaxID=2528007 RepID=A0A518CM91_9PLAN|nr:GntR family transcriptional regulator [Polystyrenella longa]QDU80350.1 transcriptional regulator NanR [Polystyrenella longa]